MTAHAESTGDERAGPAADRRTHTVNDGTTPMTTQNSTEISPRPLGCDHYEASVESRCLEVEEQLAAVEHAVRGQHEQARQ